MRKVLESIADVAKKTAKASVNSASFFAIYQPNEPEELREKKAYKIKKCTKYCGRILLLQKTKMP